jgi:hypothetical protein
MDGTQRVDEIGAGLESLRSGWPFLLGEVNRRIAELTEQLINNDNEQTRGRIKALLEVKNLPASLQAEREGLSAALAD